MRPKAICDLAQLSPGDLVREISTGIELIVSNALTLEQDAQAIHDRKTNSYDVLLAIAREEAAKALILFDIVRCPRESAHFACHLKKFNDHLAKGIYAEMCDWEPATFGDVKKYVDAELDEFYLDGPNDYDWFFWNRIRNTRDCAMYVDYISCEGEHSWTGPTRIERLIPHLRPRVISIAAGLRACGCTSPEALSVVSSVWKATSVCDDYSRRELRALNHRTLENMEARGLLKADDEDAVATIVNYLPFPIYSLDLKIRRKSQATLSAIRDAKLSA
jgi:AbiV family abortive infection protein